MSRYHLIEIMINVGLFIGILAAMRNHRKAIMELEKRIDDLTKKDSRA